MQLNEKKIKKKTRRYFVLINLHAENSSFNVCFLSENNILACKFDIPVNLLKALQVYRSFCTLGLLFHMRLLHADLNFPLLNRLF